MNNLFGKELIEFIFQKLRSTDKKVEIDESKKVLEELIYMVNNN